MSKHFEAQTVMVIVGSAKGFAARRFDRIEFLLPLGSGLAASLCCPWPNLTLSPPLEPSALKSAAAFAVLVDHEGFMA